MLDVWGQRLVERLGPTVASRSADQHGWIFRQAPGPAPMVNVTVRSGESDVWAMWSAQGTLSMRRLAKECGVGAMTLYGYIRTKDDVLEALADRLFSGLELSEDDTLPWQDRVARVLGSLRAVLLKHPDLLPVVGTQRLDGIEAYRGAEALFAALAAAGLEARQAVYAFDALVSFTIGSVQREVGLDRDDRSQFTGLRKLPSDEFPHVITVAGYLVTADAEASFTAGLDLLIAGIANWAHRTTAQ